MKLIDQIQNRTWRAPIYLNSPAFRRLLLAIMALLLIITLVLSLSGCGVKYTAPDALTDAAIILLHSAENEPAGDTGYTQVGKFGWGTVDGAPFETTRVNDMAIITTPSGSSVCKAIGQSVVCN